MPTGQTATQTLKPKNLKPTKHRPSNHQVQALTKRAWGKPPQANMGSLQGARQRLKSLLGLCRGSMSVRGSGVWGLQFGFRVIREGTHHYAPLIFPLLLRELLCVVAMKPRIRTPSRISWPIHFWGRLGLRV